MDELTDGHGLLVLSYVFASGHRNTNAIDTNTSRHVCLTNDRT